MTCHDSDGPAPRSKDIGQQETGLLTSAKASQVAFVRREGDLSAMTYFLARLLEESPSPVTLTAAYEHVKVKVPAYIQEKFPGAIQTPILIDYTTSPIYLRP